MGLGFDKIKRDFARHKAKAGVLAVLAVVMLVFIVKAVFDMAPRAAVAEAQTAGISGDALVAGQTPESEEHLRESKELWKTLREKRGLDPSVAFSFDPAPGYYTLNPDRKIAPVAEKVDPVDPSPKIPVTNAEAERAKRKADLVAETRSLVVRSTVMGSGISKPVAVISDQSAVGGDRILAVGDYIKGFEITAIRAREVEFKKDGITLAVEMANSPNGR